MIGIKPNEALDVFNNWKSDDADILCVPVRLFGWTFSIRGKITSIVNGQIAISSGRNGTITIDLTTEDMVLTYAEAAEAGVEYDAPILTVGLPLRIPPSACNSPITPVREALAFVAMPIGS